MQSSVLMHFYKMDKESLWGRYYQGCQGQSLGLSRAALTSWTLPSFSMGSIKEARSGRRQKKEMHSSWLWEDGPRGLQTSSVIHST